MNFVFAALLSIFSVTSQGDPCHIHVSAGNDMKFNVPSISTSCKDITLTLDNVGTFDKLVMGHNLVISDKEDTKSILTESVAAGREGEYSPSQDNPKVLAMTRMLGGGESDTIIFSLEPGTYEFYCTFPGHYGMMRGEFIVE